MACLNMLEKKRFSEILGAGWKAGYHREGGDAILFKYGYNSVLLSGSLSWKAFVDT